MADGYIRIDTKILDGNFSKDISRIKTGLLALSGAMTALGVKSISVGKDFEKSMSQVGATMGLTVEEIRSGTGAFAELEKVAREAGATTEWSASESAQALNYMALAGYNAEQSIKTLPTVLNLATAGGLELARASDMITDAMSSLGLNLDSASDFADVLVKASQRANASVGQFGEAILTVGGTARILKGGVVELTSALGVLANAGYKGAEGGTVLRNVILSLTAPTSMASKEFEKLGVSAFDSAGNMRNLQDILGDLNDKLSSLTAEERENILNKIFNRREIGAVKLLMSDINKGFVNLKNNLNESKGSAKETAKVMQDNLAGSLKSLRSKFEDLNITIYKNIIPTLKESVDELGKFIQEFAKGEEVKEFSNAISTMVKGLSELIKNILPLAIQTFKLFGQALSFISRNINELLVAFAGYKAGVIAMSVATKIAVGGMTAIWTAFNTFFMTSVVGAIIVGLVYFGKKIVEVKDMIKTSFNKLDELKTKPLTEQQKQLALLIAEYEKLSMELKTRSIPMVNRFMGSFDEEKARKRLDELKEKIETLKKTMKPEKSDSVDSQVKQVSEEMQGLINNITNANKKIGEQKSSFEQLEEEYKEAEKKILDLRTEYADGGIFNVDLLSEEQKAELEKQVNSLQELSDRIDSIKTGIADKNRDISETVQRGWADFTTAIGDGIESLVQVIASGEASINDILKNLQGSMASIISQMGDALITQGTAMQVAETMSPSAMIAYGILMKTLAGLLKASMAKTSAGNYANGGIVGGSSYSGDRLTANVNSGELILNMAQQENLANMLLAKANTQPLVNIEVINNTNSQVGIQQDEMNNIKILIDSEINSYMTGSKGEKMLSSNYGIRKVGIR